MAGLQSRLFHLLPHQPRLYFPGSIAAASRVSTLERQSGSKDRINCVLGLFLFSVFQKRRPPSFDSSRNRFLVGALVLFFLGPRLNLRRLPEEFRRCPGFPIWSLFPQNRSLISRHCQLIWKAGFFFPPSLPLQISMVDCHCSFLLLLSGADDCALRETERGGWMDRCTRIKLARSRTLQNVCAVVHCCKPRFPPLNVRAICIGI